MAIRTSYVKATRADKTSTFAGDVTLSKSLTVSGDFAFGDASADALTLTGLTTVVTDQKIQFRDTGIYIQSAANGKITISADGSGTDDITLSGYVTLSEGVILGSSGTPTSLTYNGNKAIAIYTTCASTNTGTSYEPVLINTVMTGIGQVGGRFKVNMETNVALGGWANAAKFQIDMKTNGGATGLMSASCHEMIFPASAGVAGTYAVLEAEIVCPTSWAGISPVNVLYAEASGATKANFDTYGLFFTLAGVTEAAGKIFRVAAPTTLAASLKCKVAGTTYYLPLYTTQN